MDIIEIINNFLGQSSGNSSEKEKKFIIAEILQLVSNNFKLEYLAVVENLEESSLPILIISNDKFQNISQNDIYLIEDFFVKLNSYFYIDKKQEILSTEHGINDLEKRIQNFKSINFVALKVHYQNYYFGYLIAFYKEDKKTVELKNSLILLSKFLSSIYSNNYKDRLLTNLNEKLSLLQKIESNHYIQSGILHDVNNVISSANLLLELIKKEVKNNYKLNEQIENINKLFIQASRVIKKAIKKDDEAQNIVTDFFIEDLFNEIYNFLKDILPKRIKLSLFIDKNLPKIKANYSELYQVILNLCINARDAITSDGEIKINCELTTEIDQLKNTDKDKENKFFKISVTDTGCGIPKSNYKKIFQPHFTTKENSGGTGLGLYVCNTIIKKYNGFIELQSTVGKGTTFNIYLPYSPNKEVRSIRILIADDEIVLTKLLLEMLESYGYIVTLANTEQEIFNEFRNNLDNYDVIILDYYLGDFSADKIISECDISKSMKKIIITTGVMEENIIENLHKSGLNKIVQKPYDFDLLINYINNSI